MILDLTYPISQRNGDDFLLTDIEIGSICVAGDVLLVSWFNHLNRTYGVDVIDYEYKLDGAYIDSMVTTTKRTEFNNFSGFLVAYNLLPGIDDLELYYSTDYGLTWTEMESTVDTDRMIVSSDLIVEGTVIQVRLKFRSDDNNAPVVESMGITYV